ncbi:MAG: hypothetical protein R3E77_05375 [Steroidobacteraceae bacterium]
MPFDVFLTSRPIRPEKQLDIIAKRFHVCGRPIRHGPACWQDVLRRHGIWYLLAATMLIFGFSIESPQRCPRRLGNRNWRVTQMTIRSASLAVCCLCIASGTWAVDAEAPIDPAPVKSPEQQFKDHPTRLADLPPGWSTNNPIRLQVCFNLKYAPNSHEANQFLLTWYRRISEMPYVVDLRMERLVYPAQFTYCANMMFKNWAHNRAYETSDVFLKYYYEVWKPAVTEMAEQMTILDIATTPR